MKIDAMIAPAAVAAVLAFGGAAFAACPTGSEGLPNSKWSWQEDLSSSSTSTSTSIGEIDYRGSSGNGDADVTTTTTTTTVCLAINPGGNVVDDKSTSTTSVTTETTNQQVCFQGSGGTDLSPDCR